jgi:hypothetical protein
VGLKIPMSHIEIYRLGIPKVPWPDGVQIETGLS